MPAIFNALPGLEVPVGSISKSLAKMWATTADNGGAAPASDDSKATQVNFVLHLGYKTSAEDAAAQFQTAVRFSKRYPCRVVVLCPTPEDEPGNEFRAKIYGECHPGKTKGDTRCCEFVMLSYPMSARRFLESQVSVCLSTDLPLYYWAHRFSSTTRLNDYQYLLRRSKRVLFDSALAPADAPDYPWPANVAVRDLAHARLLHVRQAIGQFLSGYAPDLLVRGLTGIVAEYSPDFAAEAKVLLGWAKKRLIACGADAAQLGETLRPAESAGNRTLNLQFTYNLNGHRFLWSGNFTQGCARTLAEFGDGPSEVSGAIGLLSPEAALSEAMFF
ncbi:MAG: glucose-6-phosphate dehydrogenase assembly protein OpcA [Verrucomicrobiota bacterium]